MLPVLIAVRELIRPLMLEIVQATQRIDHAAERWVCRDVRQPLPRDEDGARPSCRLSRYSAPLRIAMCDPPLSRLWHPAALYGNRFCPAVPLLPYPRILFRSYADPTLNRPRNQETDGVPGRAGGYPPGPPQTRTCAIHASGSSGRAAAARAQSTGLPWSGLVSSKSLLPFLDQRNCPALPSRPCGSLGPRFPTFTRYCASLRLPSSVPGRFTCRSLPVPCRLRVLGVPFRLAPGGSPRATPGSLVPVTLFRRLFQGDGRLSRVPGLPL